MDEVVASRSLHLVGAALLPVGCVAVFTYYYLGIPWFVRVLSARLRSFTWRY
jgi:hypothetical protein